MTSVSPQRQLATYRAKRDFSQTAEPSGATAKPTGAGRSYLVQKHAATRLHYDFRLELDGVLKSWAVTKGPSLNPEDKRLAVHVEDHPLDYGSFEGTIPQGQYGGGTVMLWDEGTWEAIGDAERGLAKGNLTFTLHGKRLKGRWHLVRLRGRPGEGKRENWLLIKGKDEFADANGESAIQQHTTSIVSRRTMEGIAGGKGKTWTRRGAKKKSAEEAKDAVAALMKKKARTARPVAARTLKLGPGAPKFVSPQLATLVTHPPTGEHWVHEIKFDGYRLLAHIEGGSAHLITRAGNDWTHKFSALAGALSKLNVSNALIDGEAVHLNEDGTISFHGLQNALSTRKMERVRYYAFDLLFIDGNDTRSMSLLERKARLKKVLEGAPSTILYSEHFEGPGDKVLGHACHLALEGIVSKRADRPYVSGRTDDWLKSKCVKEQELVVGGYTEQPKHPGMLGALLVGYYKDGKLQFAGKVGTGFTQSEGRVLFKRLEGLRTDEPSFASRPRGLRRTARYVAPELVAHVNFSEWTPDGKLRHPSFQGLREDKPASEVVREKEKPLSKVKSSKSKSSPAKSQSNNVVAGITITHPDRVLWPDSRITKLDLAKYYAAIAPRLLAQAGRRPMSLVRCPQGDIGQCFFQRHAGQGMSSHVKGVLVEGHGEGKPYIYIEDAAGLVSLVQMGTIELHVWNAMVDSVKKPDRVIFDLDPAPQVKWERVRDAAHEVRDNLKRLGLVSFLKTTGGKGLHVVVPFKPGPSWAEAKRFARAFSDAMAKNAPDRFTINSRKDVRTGRIFIDYLRNDETASAVAAYSVRARQGAPVSMPIDWKELGDLRSGSAFGMAETLKRRGDPWRAIAKAGKQRLPLAK